MKIYLIDNADRQGNYTQLNKLIEILSDNFTKFSNSVNSNKAALENELSEKGATYIGNAISAIENFNCKSDLVGLQYSKSEPKDFIEENTKKFGKDDFFVMDLCLTHDEENDYQLEKDNNLPIKELSGHRLGKLLVDEGISSHRIVLISKIVSKLTETELFGRIITKPFLRLRTDPELRPGNVAVPGIGMPKCLAVPNYVLDFCFKIYSKAFGLI